MDNINDREGYVGATRVFEIPRLIGNTTIALTITISSTELLRKPGAFAVYRYRDDLFPTTIFRQSYDRLASSGSERADRDYVRILHLAATTFEAEVEMALQIVLEAGKIPSFVTVRDLVQIPTIPALSTPDLNLADLRYIKSEQFILTS